jgi:hypothetical protein
MCFVTGNGFLFAQNSLPDAQQRKLLTTLIDQYAVAREKRDTVLLKKILTADVDQLVSTGEWRSGLRAAVDGMLRSSATAPGTRTLRVERIRMLSLTSALVDCKYEILNKDGSARNMWSSFVMVAGKNGWKISAIRNMLPASQKASLSTTGTECDG